MRPSADSLSAIGRPWLGRPDVLVKLASADPGLADIPSPQMLSGPPDVGSWLRDRQNGLGASDHPYSTYVDAESITRAALGRDEDDLLWLFDRMHALHYAALNGIEWVDDKPAENKDTENSPAGQRRIQQLLSSPGLMRLFGFARDVYLDFAEDLPPDGLGKFVNIKSADTNEFLPYKTTFELNRGLGLFYPATRNAFTPENGGVDPVLKYGIRRLSNKDKDGRSYSPWSRSRRSSPPTRTCKAKLISGMPGLPPGRWRSCAVIRSLSH
jgi:hypothetical protein